jgi:hypothetical protein
MSRKIWIVLSAFTLTSIVPLGAFADERLQKPVFADHSTGGGAVIGGATYVPVDPLDTADVRGHSVVSTATPIWYRFTGIGSGSIGALTFTQFTIVMLSDISRIVVCPPGVSSIDGSSTIEMDGVGTAVFEIGTRVFSNQYAAGVGLSKAGCEGWDLLDMQEAVFGAYALDTPFGPVTEEEPYAFQQFSGVPTSLGWLTFDFVDYVTFQAFIASNTPLVLSMDQNDTLHWPPQPGVNGYDIVRGGLDVLRASGFTASTHACLANDVSVTSVFDPQPPVPGFGFWYLLRALYSTGSVGSYDVESTGTQRDDGIGASPNGCP